MSVVALALAAGLHDARAESTDGKGGLHIAARALTPDEAAAGDSVEFKYFSTFADAVRFASGGAVSLASGVGPAELTQRLASGGGGAASSSSSTIIGIDYDDTYWGTGSGTITWYVPNGVGCSGGGTYVSNAMPGGWDNRVSSAQALGGCNTFRHYQHTFLGGAFITCNCLTMGSMNNQTSSERWSP